MPNTVGEYMGLKKKKDGSWSKSGDPLRTRAATDDYREGMERMGMGSSLDRYCRGCGLLPAWCECFNRKTMKSAEPMIRALWTRGKAKA